MGGHFADTLKHTKDAEMKLGTRGRHAVMALIDLASNSDGAPIPLADIASRQQISLSYLEQLFSRLRQAGLVESVRGPGGGYMLRNGAKGTRINDVLAAVEATDSDISSEEPHLNSGKAPAALWTDLLQYVEAFLSGVTLDDLLQGRISRHEPEQRDVLAG